MRLENTHNVSTSSYSTLFHWFHLPTHISHFSVVLASQPTVFTQYGCASKIGCQAACMAYCKFRGQCPHSQNNIKTLERIQRQAARFCTNNYSREPGSVTKLLQELGWETLQTRRKAKRITSLFETLTPQPNLIIGIWQPFVVFAWMVCIMFDLLHMFHVI